MLQTRSDRRRWITLASAALLVTSISCSHHAALPAVDSDQYRDFAANFYVGLAALETGEDVRAREKLGRASQLASGEAATWANLALFAARQQNFDEAFKDAEAARDRAPSSSRVEALLGFIEAKRGRLPEAIQDLRKAVDLDGGNLKALYGLAEQTERQGEGQDAAAEALFQKVLARAPGNLAVLLDVTRLAAKRGDVATLQSSIARLTSASSAWPEEGRRQLEALRQAAAGPAPRSAAVRVSFLRNVLARDPGYRQSLDAVKTPSAFVGEPFTRFLDLPAVASLAAPADAGLRFAAEPLAGVASQDVIWAGAFPLDDSGKQTVVTASKDWIRTSSGATLPLGAGTLGRNGILGADLNYDFKTDLVVAGPSGVRIFQQQDPAHFVDVTPQTKLPADVVRGAATGAWAFDVDLDGDLDLLVGRPDAESLVLRNNGDGVFAVLRPFPGVTGLKAFASADIDGDGDPDLAMIGGNGELHVFTNERLGQYRPRPLPASLKGRFLAVSTADMDGDGLLDFILLRDDGSVVRLSDRNSGRDWDTGELVPPSGAGLNDATANLILADFDNNGSLDILAGDGRLYLSAPGAPTHFLSVALPPGVEITSAVDLKNDGRLEAVGFTTKPLELAPSGTKNYKWQTLRVRAANAHGDQRMNSFGIGGEIEDRAGLLTQKQEISSPVLHFGLGEHSETDVARIVWPNGSVQAEFSLRADQSLLAQQRLKGSCPFLFAWNGKQVEFVKDGEPWSPALGLHVNAQVVAGISQTQEWFKIPGRALVPRDGYYDVRVTGELWESYYIDHYSLLAVDHPEDSDVYTDERFSNPPPALKVYTVARPQPFASVRDDRGADVSRIVRDLDANYLDTFGRGRYQGVTRDHWVEVELPESAPRTGDLYLLGSGWMHPTDGTVNVALGQNSDPPPQGLSLETPDRRGRWTAVASNLGFLAGRNKTAVLEISRLFQPGAPRKLRLRTNLEIYWDQLAWAPGLPATETHIQRSALTSADLRFRGFSEIHVANASSPEIPDYNHVTGTSQKWRDLEGYYTRYGDVRELLERIDDHMVITNAGDELRLRFAEVPPPPAGWKRDYVMIGDGWIKDGDYNSVFSKTVLPLPYHAMKDYMRPPAELEDDPAYCLHPEDWQRFHTRYVTPSGFIRALWN